MSKTRENPGFLALTLARALARGWHTVLSLLAQPSVHRNRATPVLQPQHFSHLVQQFEFGVRRNQFPPSHPVPRLDR
jgi:hypothetical protein